MNLWRTQRPRFPLYESDGSGRDYFIKFNNAGYWGPDQVYVKKVNDYERPKYNNFHTLYHEAAPFKYYADGKGRETYILNQDGFFHPQKPLCTFNLNDFLRGKTDNSPMKKKIKYKSVAEKKYNSKLQSFEKELLKRLYNDKSKKKKKVLKSTDFKNERYKELNENIPLNIIIRSFPCLNKNFNKNSFDKQSQSLKKIDNYDSLFKQSKQIQKYELDCYMDRNKKFKNKIEFNKNSLPVMLRKNTSCKSYLSCNSYNFK